MLTRDLLALVTIFRPENALNDLAQAIELRDVSGLPLEDLAIFRPERLALHELLVRITADYEVPDPDDASVDSLGANLRRMTKVLAAQVIDRHRAEIGQLYDQVRGELETSVKSELSAAFSRSATGLIEEQGRSSRGLWARLLGQARDQAPQVPESDWDRDEQIVRDWAARALAKAGTLNAAVLCSLLKAVAAIRLQHGRILGERTFLVGLATDLACNEYGAAVIGRFLEPRIHAAAQQEGFRKLPAQSRPVAMVTKGASASGKSTMRPLQRSLAAKMGLAWSDYALISPDIWRKALLDFASLGSLHKYAGMLTSHEVTIIDKKLDSYLVHKGRNGETSHLLVDRFRFDSFALDSEENKHLPSGYGKLLLYFFMITPPQETVKRAWQRGLEVGRYKAVDDLLAHNVEAYTGMQHILFGRTLDPTVSVHYEFLDNDVPRGEVPYTAAFGWSGELNVLDVKCMLNLDRYRKINIHAKSPDEVYLEQAVNVVEENRGFLTQCVQRFPRVSFADRDTGCIYAHFEAGKLQWLDPTGLTRAGVDDEVMAALYHLVMDSSRVSACGTRSPERLRPADYHTIGRWASRNLIVPEQARAAI